MDCPIKKLLQFVPHAPKIFNRIPCHGNFTPFLFIFLWGVVFDFEILVWMFHLYDMIYPIQAQPFINDCLHKFKMAKTELCKNLFLFICIIYQLHTYFRVFKKKLQQGYIFNTLRSRCITDNCLIQYCKDLISFLWRFYMNF